MLTREQLKSKPLPNGCSNLSPNPGPLLIRTAACRTIPRTSSRRMVLLLPSRPKHNSPILIPISSEDWMVKKWCRMVKDMRESKPVRFGIVGCGAASIPVCEAITASSRTELTAVYDVSRVLAEDISQRFHAPVMDTFEELLTNQTVNAVYVAVPHHL